MPETTPPPEDPAAALAALRDVFDLAAELAARVGAARDLIGERIAQEEARLARAAPELASLPPRLHDHRPGRRAKLATDPELRAFVEARFERMTFEQIEREVEEHFGEPRIRRSAIHAWFKKNGARSK